MLTALLTFCIHGLYALHTHFFFLQHKTILMRCEHQNNAPTTAAVGLHHTGALNNRGKTKICRKHQIFEANE